MSSKTTNIVSLIYRAKLNRSKLTVKENKMLNSLISYFNNRGHLSVRQLDMLEVLANKICSIQQSRFGSKIKRNQ